jgi:hypothetical protein
MTKLLDLAVPRTLDVLVSDLLQQKPVAPVEAWLFDDGPSRRAAEEKLAASGVKARIRSAYKPLVYFFLEEVDIASLARIEIGYPIHAAAAPSRFLIEAYPLAALVGDAEISFHNNDLDLTYDIKLTTKRGEATTYHVFAPNVVEDDHVGTTVLRCCGWRKTEGTKGERLQTDFETLFLAAIDAVKTHEWQRKEPYFDRLRIVVELPARDVALDFCSEVISLREAMHEDLFFSVRECLNATMGAMAGRGGARPGQVVPDIKGTDGSPRIVMTVEDFGEHGETEGDTIPMETADRPLKIGQIRQEVSRIDGEEIHAVSREGRDVVGRYRKGSGPAVLISSGQHANETSGPVGALRAAQKLAADPQAHFAIIPVENVDGYELHQRLIVENPFHMHHAARYTAMGDDLSFTVPDPNSIYERAARNKALALSGAKLHLNLHGYPSHEWTRPMSGYLPRGFEMWTIPKGFFLILCAHPGWEEIGEALMDEVALKLSADKNLVAFNAKQLACVKVHMPEAPFEVRYGIPCIRQVSEYYQAPMTIITEATDETVYGQDFIDTHDAQTNTVLNAVEIYCRLVEQGGLPTS